MIEFTDSKLSEIYIHHVGNKLRDEQVRISNGDVSFTEEETENYLMKYVLSPFNNNEVFNFSHTSSLDLNEIYVFVKKLFTNPDLLYKTSIEISKHLYEQSTHPKISGGDLCVCYFKKCLFDGVICDAIGIFKSEIKDVFLNFKSINDSREITHDKGINIGKLDKGCMIFNLDHENGYKVCVVDAKSKDTQYWKDDFLKIKPASDEFHFTNDFLTSTKNFVVNQLSNDFDMEKADQIDLLNRSVEYFKTNETFEKENFEKEVFQDDAIIESFRSFDSLHKTDSEIERKDRFEISPHAVKKQSRAFKKVLKLDKNFHIYIHGDRDLIEQGTEADGRKFYKIYYDSEQ